jgi:hypothetical protein
MLSNSINPSGFPYAGLATSNGVCHHLAMGSNLILSSYVSITITKAATVWKFEMNFRL